MARGLRSSGRWAGAACPAPGGACDLSRSLCGLGRIAALAERRASSVSFRVAHLGRLDGPRHVGSPFGFV